MARGSGARVPTLNLSDLQTHRHVRTWWNIRYISFYLASFVVLIMSLAPQHLLWLGELRSGRLEWASTDPITDVIPLISLSQRMYGLLFPPPPLSSTSHGRDDNNPSLASY